ncbi:hypothetical protein D6C82_01063 [Aureobasidium pullulans]|nr:hypothetical protein D6C82_01063 [Aureobasidium pullulans]
MTVEHDISIERIVVTLQATKTRSSSEIERVLGSVQESWNVDDLFAVARGLRREIELAHDTAAAESKTHLRSTDRLREERDAFKKEAEDARRQVEALEREVNDLNAKIKEDSQALDADNNSLDRVKTLEGLLAAAATETDELRSDNAVLVKTDEARATMVKGLDASNTKLTIEIEALRGRLETTEVNTSDRVQSLVEQVNQYAKTTVEGLGSFYGEKFSECYNEVANTNKLNSELEAQVETLSNQVNDLESKQKVAERSIEMWHDAYCEIEDEKMEWTKKEHEYNQSSDKQNALVESRSATIQRLEKTQAKADRRILKLEKERNSLAEALSASNSEIDTVRTIHTEVQEKLELVESLSAFYHLIHYALAELPESLRSTSTYGIKEVTLQVTNIIKKYEGLQVNVDKQTNSSTDLSNKISQLQHERAVQATNVQQLEKTLKNAKAHNEASREEVATLSRTRDEMQEQIKRLTIDSEKLSGTEKSRDDALADLEKAKERGDSIDNMRQQLYDKLATSETLVRSLTQTNGELSNKLSTANSNEQNAIATGIERLADCREKVNEIAKRERDALDANIDLTKRWSDVFNAQSSWQQKYFASQQEALNEKTTARNDLSAEMNARQAAERALTQAKNERDQAMAELQDIKQGTINDAATIARIANEREQLEKQHTEFEDALKALKEAQNQLEKDQSKLAGQKEAHDTSFHKTFQLKADMDKHEGVVSEKENALNTKTEEFKLSEAAHNSKVEQFSAKEKFLRNDLIILKAEGKRLTQDLEAAADREKQLQKSKTFIEEQLRTTTSRADETFKHQTRQSQEFNDLYKQILKGKDDLKDLKESEKSIMTKLDKANVTITEQQDQLREAQVAADRTARDQQHATQTDLDTLRKKHADKIAELRLEHLTELELKRIEIKDKAEKIEELEGEAYQYTQLEAKSREDLQARDTALKLKSDELDNIRTELRRSQEAYKTLERQYEKQNTAQRALEKDLQTVRERLNDIMSAKDTLEMRLRVTLSHLRQLVFDYSQDVDNQVFEHLAGVETEFDSLHKTFPTRYRWAVTKKAWSWTLSMASESETRPFLGQPFSQLTVRLCFMMSSLREEGPKIFILIETMLQLIEACRSENILQLASSLQFYLESSEQIDSEHKMLVVARVIELIHRAANSLELYWSGSAVVFDLWKSKVSQYELCAQHLFVRAYFAWFAAYEKAVLYGIRDFTLTLPELWMLIGDTDDIGLGNISYTLLHSTDEVLLGGRPGKPRRLFADRIASSTDDYAIVDLDKQSIFVYRQAEGIHNIGKVVLTLTKRLNGDGDFEEVAPFMMTYVDIRFVDRYMKGVFRRALLRLAAMEKPLGG